MTRARHVVDEVRKSGFWKPSSMRLFAATRPGRSRTASGVDPRTRLVAAADWLSRAQDATGDGGVSWAFRLHEGWRPSYPETTGYIVPTFLELSKALDAPAFLDRAERAIGFLASVRLANGAFPAGTLESPDRTPSIFNTGQIINGLTAWFRETGDEAARRMACDAADWLVDVQDDDGAWRRFGYQGYPVTYNAHVSCWVAELGQVLGERRYLAAASKHLDWVLGQQDSSTGWFDRTGFSDADHAARRSVTHTFAYTVWGVLHGGLILQRDDAVEGASRAARAAAALMARTGWLPGVIDSDFQGRSHYACLTGNAQMALIWMRLADVEPDGLFETAASHAIDLVGAAQSVSEPNPGIRGGIPGSDPVWGAYLRNTLPNWSAKFYVDALLMQARNGAKRVASS